MRSAIVLASVLVSPLFTASPPHAAEGRALTLTAARVTIEGTSNVHAYSASTTDVRVTGIELSGAPSGDVLAYVLAPGTLERFDVVIPARSLKSDKTDLDKNMHKALKVQQFAEIRFRLRALEAVAGGYRGVGTLTVAGVENEVTLHLQAERIRGGLAVTGTTDLLMTDYGIAPPRAMLGMLKTDAKVKIRIELLLGT